jgi:hypothetical protein
VARGEQYFVTILDPKPTDGAADMAGANGSDRLFAVSGLRAQLPW